jgi:ADP-heptose:LPS heptosyltransferase
MEAILGGNASLYDLVKRVYIDIRRLRARGFDLVMNLSVTPLSAFITRLVGGRRVWGLLVDEFARPVLRGNLWVLYTFYIKANRPMEDLNRLDLMELHLRMADVNPRERRLFLFIDEKTRKRCLYNLSSYGVREGNLVIGLNPGAGFRSRCWPVEKFAKLGDRLSKDYGAKIIIFGGPKEKEIGEELERKMESKPINLTGKTSLKELAAYLSRCDHLITNDTGPMHIGAAMGTKVIGICGPTLVGPLGEGHLLIRADLPCVGCGTTSTCTKGDCMEAVDPEDVMNLFRYQRKEIDEIPDTPGIHVYSAQEGKPPRLFFYRPINKMTDQKGVEAEILRLIYLNLWIRENNSLGFLYEDEISWEEMMGELLMEYRHDDVGAGVKRVIKRLKDYKSGEDEGIEGLLALYDLLYTDPLHLQRAKAGAIHYMVNFLEILRGKYG